MDEIFKQFAVQFVVAAVFAGMLWKVYSDGKAERKYMMDLLEKLYIRDVSSNGESLSDHEETLMKRP